MATFQTNCQVQAVDISAGAACIVYIPEGISDLAILKPNKALQDMLDGKADLPVPSPQAQGIACAFSSQKRSSGTSKSCTLL